MPATPDHIKDALRTCKTAGDVHRVADQYRADVKALASDPARKALALHISNLKAYRLWEIRNPK